MKVYDETGEPTTGKNPFPQWSPLDIELQREARSAIHAIPQFPELEKRLIAVFGPTAETIMLHQIVGYWFRKEGMRDRWVAWKTRDEWREERGLNRKQVDKGRARMKSRGVVEERMGPYKRVHYRIDWVKLAELLGLWDDHDSEAHDAGALSDASNRTPGDPSDPPLGDTDPSASPANGHGGEEHPHHNGESGGPEPIHPRYPPTHQNGVQKRSAEDHGHESSPAGGENDASRRLSPQSGRMNKERLQGMMDAAMRGNDPDGDGRSAADRMLHRLLVLMHDGENEIGSLVDRHLEEGRDEDGPAAAKRIAEEARGLLGSDRPLGYLAGAAEFYLSQMRGAARDAVEAQRKETA